MKNWKYVAIAVVIVVIIIIIAPQLQQAQQTREAIRKSASGEFNPATIAEAISTDLLKWGWSDPAPYSALTAESDDNIRKVYAYWSARLRQKHNGQTLTQAIDSTTFYWNDEPAKTLEKLRKLNLP